ncbi:hypothetical protein [Brevundimonas sp.]|uniref:hypothetical protein n=1 Tax=Brevundimonas sp. TaxID=1871086 RepID=UPI003D6CAC98
MGTNIWYLQSLSPRQGVGTPGGVRKNVNSLLESLEKFGLPVSRRAARDLEKYCNENLVEENEDVSSLIGQERADEIKKLASRLRPTINAESLGLFAYLTTEKRFSTENLMTDPWKLFAEGIKGRIDDVPVRDIEDAAKCIVFERATAAAFHLLRATEAVLKQFYCHHIRRNRGQLMWGPMISGLRAKRNPPDSALLDHLDSIRRNFRNPTQHPEKIYDMVEAQDLFGVCIDVLNRMSSDLPDRSQ